MLTKVQLYTTDVPFGTRDIVYKGLVCVNKTKCRNIAANFSSGIQSLMGGEVTGMTKLTKDVRDEVIAEASEQALSMGANAITGIRIETSSVFDGILDVVLYGTAIYYT